MIAGFQIIEREITERIKDDLDKLGLLYRMFSRCKNEKSIIEKIERKVLEGDPYQIGGKLMQDGIGVRVVTYFRDDVELIKEIFEKKKYFNNVMIDEPGLTVFEPKRTNLICPFNEKQTITLKEIQNSSSNEVYHLLDNTYELQLRTILSEGWHEIDHSLRYKCKKDWVGHYENERLLNGIYASLEANDITLKNLFNELSYRHMKNRNWEAFLRTKFRLDVQLPPLRKEILDILNSKPELGKKIQKIDRHKFLLYYSQVELSLPINMTNLVYLINAFYIKDEDILRISPLKFDYE